MTKTTRRTTMPAAARWDHSHRPCRSPAGGGRTTRRRHGGGRIEGGRRRGGGGGGGGVAELLGPPAPTEATVDNDTRRVSCFLSSEISNRKETTLFSTIGRPEQNTFKFGIVPRVLDTRYGGNSCRIVDEFFIRMSESNIVDSHGRFRRSAEMKMLNAVLIRFR